MIRAVLDTNTIISGIGWSGPPKVILDAAIKGQFLLLLSSGLLDEIRRVVAYPRLRVLPQTRVQEVLALLPHISVVVEPEERLTIIRADPADNRILECAVAGEATHIVTGDSHLLDLESFRNIPIVPPADFVEVLKQQGKKGRD